MSQRTQFAFTAANAGYLARTFLGNSNAPRRVLCYVMDATATDLTPALTWLATQTFDYLYAPPDVTPQEAETIKTWILGQRAQRRTYKAVLPHFAANSEAIINVTTDIYRLTQAEGDTAIDAGGFILIHDGRKVKVGRGVNGLTTLTGGKTAIYKKIKIVELLDMIDHDIRVTAADSYIGRGNSYQNKLVLVTAISSYFQQLEAEGSLQPGSTVAIDIAATRAWLVAQRIDISDLSDQEIREHATGDKVFLTASITPLDAIEDIALTINL